MCTVVYICSGYLGKTSRTLRFRVRQMACRAELFTIAAHVEALCRKRLKIKTKAPRLVQFFSILELRISSFAHGIATFLGIVLYQFWKFAFDAYLIKSSLENFGFTSSEYRTMLLEIGPILYSQHFQHPILKRVSSAWFGLVLFLEKLTKHGSRDELLVACSGSLAAVNLGFLSISFVLIIMVFDSSILVFLDMTAREREYPKRKFCCNRLRQSLARSLAACKLIGIKVTHCSLMLHKTDST